MVCAPKRAQRHRGRPRAGPLAIDAGCRPRASTSPRFFFQFYFEITLNLTKFEWNLIFNLDEID
jgi:hypothetical protein